MTVTVLSSFVEAKNEKEKARAKQRKRQHWRYLGGRINVAHHDYRCHRCIFPIFPGEQYQRDVYANHLDIHIERHHFPQCYGPSEEEDRQIREQIERDRQAEREAERKAA